MGKSREFIGETNGKDSGVIGSKSVGIELFLDSLVNDLVSGVTNMDIYIILTTTDDLRKVLLRETKQS